MAQLLAVWCVAWMATLACPPAATPTGEKAKDLPRPFSKSVRVGGVDFEVAAEPTWTRPAEVYGVFDPAIVLRVSNRTDKDLEFDMGGTLRVSLKAADGPELVKGPVPDRHYTKPVKVAAGKSETIALPIRLGHTRTRHVCLGVESRNVAGTNWLTGDVRPGKYCLYLSLENTRKGDDTWIGKMQTETLEIEVKASK